MFHDGGVEGGHERLLSNNDKHRWQKSSFLGIEKKSVI